MQSAIREDYTPEEIDALLREDDTIGLLKTKERKRLSRKAKKLNNQQKSNVQSIARYQDNRKIPPLTAKTERQKELIQSIRQNIQTFVTGPAGTGKTYVTAAMAAEMFSKDKKIEKIILTRPNVPAGRSLGFLPGDLNEKMANWVIPVVTVLKERLGWSENLYELALKRGKIEVVPFETIRGRSFKNAFVILDEAQNCTKEEIKAFVSRIGEDCKVVINGDIKQKDIKEDSGLSYAMKLIDRNKSLKQKIGCVDFTIDDIVRSDICADWIRAFEKDNSIF